MGFRLSGYLAVIGLIGFVGRVLALPIPAVFKNIAYQYQVPAELLYAVALNETGRQLQQKIKQPYPYAINVSGNSYFYDSPNKACTALKIFMSQYPLKNIDVGIAQVNLGWNGVRYFRTACEGFDVTTNLIAAAQILRDCYQERGNWLAASGCYHHPKGGDIAARYMNKVKQHLSLITDSKNAPKWTPPLNADNAAHFQWILPATTTWVWVAPHAD